MKDNGEYMAVFASDKGCIKLHCEHVNANVYVDTVVLPVPEPVNA
jgi:hypothetical protein